MKTKDSFSMSDDFERWMDIDVENDNVEIDGLEINASVGEYAKQSAENNINKYDTLKREFPNLKKVYGKHTTVVKRKVLTILGIQGELVWDYLLKNEITFDVDNEKFSIFSSFSDIDTSDVWYAILEKYE